MKRIILLAVVILTGCIGQDIVIDEVSPEVRITNAISNMEINTTWQFEYMFLDNVGSEIIPDEMTWSTSDADVAIVNQEGLATSLDYGNVELTLSAVINDIAVDTTIMFEVSDNPTVLSQNTRSGEIATTSSYELKGGFEISMEGNDLIIQFSSNYVADQGLPGLYVYLTNNPNTPSGGYEIGAVEVFSGAHQYRIPDTELFDYDYIFYYCKPFKVKVGHGNIE